MGTAKSKGLPRCTAHRDCFANKNGVCVCLGDNDFHGKDCPFSRPRRSVTQTGRKAMSGWSALDGTTWSSGIK